MIKRPMLAAAATSEDLEKLSYPMLASPKLDGIRVFIHPELGIVTRKLKPVPNHFIHGQFSSSYDFHGIDGEIMIKGASFNQIQSAVMSHSGAPIVEIQAFDFLGMGMQDKPFRERLFALFHLFRHNAWICPLFHETIRDADHAREYAQKCISDGYEGIVLRDRDGPYKQNRSTLKQQYMVKYKETSDAEGVVVGFEEKYHNTNPQERDELGLAKRSDKKEGMVAADTLGALILNTEWGELRVGTGFDDALRQQIWDNRKEYIRRTVTFKYQPHGMQDLPRFPVFLRFRED